MNKVAWTEPQSNAIHAQGGELLVSAAAGSGKTAVLVERVVQLISDAENPTDVTSLLVVTFSNAAATEMKQRVGVRLSDMIAAQPNNLYLQKQQTLLSSANISTVHSFCLELIRQNFQNLSISPDFVVIDENELEIFKDECIEQLIEEFYEADIQRGLFAELVELLSSGRDDRRLKETVYKIFDFARSHPFYEDWLDEKLAMYDYTIPPGKTVWGRSLLSHAKLSIEHSLSNMHRAIREIYEDEKLEKAYLPAFQQDILKLEELLEKIAQGDWDRAVDKVRNFTFDKLGSVRGDSPDKERVKAVRDNLKKSIKNLSNNYLNANEVEFSGDIEDVQPKIDLLFDLVKKFGERLFERKKLAKKLDFSDLEHLVLELLVDKQDEKYIATTQARELAKNYRYILVDEYQDTNEVQELIFTSISRSGENLFMVGDVKQSIYSFRMAMPEIFMKKKMDFFAYDGNHFPATILLDTNFRSRREVTEGVNFIFKQLMSEEMGEIDYNQAESLKCGASYEDYKMAAPELIIINAEEYEGAEDTSEIEAREVAKKIKNMLDMEYMVEIKGVKRPAEPKDFCILLRSPKKKAQIYIEKLQEQGIAAWGENTGSYLKSREVSAVTSLLKALDNPLLDIELVAALGSLIFNFTNDDLAEIATIERKTPFYLNLQKWADTGNEKAKEALEIFNYLRTFATINSAPQLIKEIYVKTAFAHLVQASPMGQRRYANLLLLVEYAEYYHTVGYKGLGGFVALLNRLEARGGDLAPANSIGDGANIVRVMSIHRSKGLEFPVVIVADTVKQFNKQDLRQNTLLHSGYGFACVRRDSETLAQYPTIPMGAIRIEMQKTMLSEEMRILYVALTRAKEKLIVVSSFGKNTSKTISDMVEELDDNWKISPFVVGEANSYAQWIIGALLHHSSCNVLRELAGNPVIELVDDKNPWEISVIAPIDSENAGERPEFIRAAKAVPELLELFRKKASFTYAFESQTKTPTKMAVSEAAGEKQTKEYRFNRRPRFLTKDGLTPAEKGTAMHSFMQFANYENSLNNLDNEIERMKNDEFLTTVQIENLNRGRLQSFFESGLANRIFNSEKVFRELRFMAELGKDELGGIINNMDNDSKIVVQGVADCVFIENGKAIIVDYKTDNVGSLADLSARYASQLKLYKEILSKSLSMSVSETIIYSFAFSDWIDTSIYK